MKDNILSDVFLGEEYAYLRPYICRGNPYNAKVFLTGINPATPIYPKQVSLDRYIEIVKNYETFMDFYLKSRKKQNKSEVSRTRMGINSLVDWIENECNTGVIETDIFTYEMKKRLEGSVRMCLAYESMLNIPIDLPDIIQQERISKVLNEFDKRINCEEIKYDYQQKLKDGLLQKMFI